jgi:hypothetical protein
METIYEDLLRESLMPEGDDDVVETIDDTVEVEEEVLDFSEEPEEEITQDVGNVSS